MRSSIVASLVAGLALAGCASRPAPGSVQANAGAPCSVQVYRNRTAFHAANPERPFVYADDQKIGGLGVGRSVCVRLPPGKHVISIRESLLFVPAWTSGTLDVDVTEGATVYVRYSMEFGGVVPSGAGPVVTGTSSLQLVDEASWRARR